MEMLLGKVVTVVAGFGAETISQDFGGMTERDTHPTVDDRMQTIART